MNARKEAVIACLLLALLVSSAFLGVCDGAVWFEGNSTEKPQEISVDMNATVSFPSCHLIINETEPKVVDLTIIVTTWRHFYQDENFETWLSIDSQKPEQLPDGILSSDMVGFLGSLYRRQYDLTLSGLGNGTHFLKIRVEGEYYMTPKPGVWGLSGKNYVCEGNATVIVDEPAPTLTQVFVAGIALVCTIIACIAIAVLYKRKRISLPRQPAPKQQEV
jgi:hypothetical protein